MKEYKDCVRDPPMNVTLGPMGSNISHWEGTLQPDSDSVYSGGIFFVDIMFPSDYPFKPPKIFFKTKIFHPNISGSGGISLDILSHSWSPALTASRCLLSILSLIDDPNPDDPMVPEIAKLYKTNREAFNTTAKEWVLKYAL
uniref:UBC core domain-containing protein n=1 Tax=Arcella intermedia TaxID=1963864 RepID=A0A6B2LQC6_9EUKA